jgi:hypothetical protein
MAWSVSNSRFEIVVLDRLSSHGEKFRFLIVAGFLDVGQQGIEVLPVGFEQRDDIAQNRVALGHEGLALRLRRDVKGMLRAVTLVDEENLALLVGDGLVDARNLRLGTDTRQAQQFLDVIGRRPRDLEIRIELENPLLDLGHAAAHLGEFPLRVFRYVFEGGRTLAFPKRLQGLVGDAHLLAEAMRFIEEELAGALVGFGAILEDVAQVFLRAGIGQTRGHNGIAVGRKHVDQAGVLAVLRRDHADQAHWRLRPESPSNPRRKESRRESVCLRAASTAWRRAARTGSRAGNRPPY